MSRKILSVVGRKEQPANQPTCVHENCRGSNFSERVEISQNCIHSDAIYVKENLVLACDIEFGILNEVVPQYISVALCRQLLSQ